MIDLLAVAGGVVVLTGLAAVGLWLSSDDEDESNTDVWDAIPSWQYESTRRIERHDP